MTHTNQPLESLQISPYDPHWIVEFRMERDSIAQALGKTALRIEHNGSTAVPGLEAKPVIDIQMRSGDRA